MQCTDRGLVKVRYETKPNLKELDIHERIYNQIPYCNLSIPVRQASRIETESDNNTLPIVEIV
jgi:hypothetical protein